MAIQTSVAVRNGQLDSIETTIGTAPILRIRTGGVPANCAAADTGTVLATITLPSDWMAAASAGAKAKSGTWQATATGSQASGTVHFRIYDSTGATCHYQGTVTATGGGGDMTLDNVSISTGQTVTVNTFTITAGNA